MLSLRKSRGRVLLVTVLAEALAGVARAQSIEPRTYSPAPAGLNFLIVGYAETRGGVAFDPSVPLTDPDLKVQAPVVAYARTLGVLGQSAKVDIIAPVGRLRGSALYRGEPIERKVEGFLDPAARLSVIFYGAPAMSAAQFRAYRQDVVVGASLQVTGPFGQYDEARLVNLGSNRWSFKPELGVSKTAGPWTVEVKGAVTFFTDNNAFFGGGSRTQEPLYGAQANAIYNLRPGMWASLDATYYTGGRTTLDDKLSNDLQRNWRLGATFAAPLSGRQAIKLYASRGVSARTGNNFDLFGIAWQTRWSSGR